MMKRLFAWMHTMSSRSWPVETKLCGVPGPITTISYPSGDGRLARSGWLVTISADPSRDEIGRHYVWRGQIAAFRGHREYAAAAAGASPA